MDRIIKSISEIENDSVKIMDEANSKKAEIFSQIKKETDAYDLETERKTNARIQSVREQMEKEMFDRLAEQKDAADHSLHTLEKHYDNNHADYVEQLFRSMTGV